MSSDDLIRQLTGMGVMPDSYEKVREKAGISVYRIVHQQNRYILKCFANHAYTREIINYQILTSLGIQTIRVINHSDTAILLEDIDTSTELRLGVEGDLSDPQVARLIARWYRQLHDIGRGYLQKSPIEFYDEADVITQENLEFIRQKSCTVGNPVWGEIIGNWARITGMIQRLDRTLTYNDFYWTNLVVARDLTHAFMFDYNLLGKGYIYGDIRNVCSSLSPVAAQAFLDEYGDFNRTEQKVDEVISPLVNLYFAYQQEVFPGWGAGSLRMLANGKLMDAVRTLVNQSS